MKRIILALIVVLPLVFAACEKDDKISFTSVQLNMDMPAILKGKNATLQNAVLTLVNVNSGEETKHNLGSSTILPFNLEDGLYNILVVGEVQYTTENAAGEELSKSETVRASYENVKVAGGKMDIDISLFFFRESAGFVISEIFFTSTKTPANKWYGRDTFIEVYNNTSEVLYADGLCIADTEFNSSQLRIDLNPDIKDTYTAVAHVYMIPGNGSQHPIQPGEAFVLCDQGIDHRTVNPTSFDLSMAKFEWFDGADYDKDVVEVPNLIKVVAKSKVYWPLNNRGFTSYILFKMDDVTPGKFADECTYTYDYISNSHGALIPMSQNAWKVPNDIIIDAVECSTKSGFEWKALHASLDMSWTHSGDGGDERYGKSVKRKIDRVEDERKILLDTNDSRFDFIPTADPSPGFIE